MAAYSQEGRLSKTLICKPTGCAAGILETDIEAIGITLSYATITTHNCAQMLVCDCVVWWVFIFSFTQVINTVRQTLHHFLKQHISQAICTMLLPSLGSVDLHDCDV